MSLPLPTPGRVFFCRLLDCGARRALTRLGVMAALLTMGLGPSGLLAQGWIDPVRPGMGSVERVESRVTVAVEGNIATIEVDEWFLNSGERVAEGHYLYPLPAGAALAGASLYQGETELRGEVMDADEARRIYEEIVRRRADPALIEYMGDGLFRARVFPIEPGQRRRVTLRYSQVLEPAGESLHFRTSGALRPTLPTHAGGEAVRLKASAPVHLHMAVTPASSFLEPFSPSHALEVDRQADTLWVDVPEAEGRVSVFLPRSSDVVGLSVLPHRPAGEDGFVLLSLTPPRITADPEPRDLVVVVDVSGSMAGSKIEQARSAVQGLLDEMRPDDRFRLVSFSNGVHRLDTEWRSADRRSLADARRWIGNLRADGGTNIEGALEAAFEVAPGRDRLPLVVFLTDGLPTVGEQDPAKISNAVEGRRGRYRIFAFGVGHDVNTGLLDRLSEATRGTTQYVEPGEDVERALSLLAARISQPVLTDLSIVEAPVAISEWYPVHIPDVFAGETLVLLARYRGEGEGAVIIEGRSGGETRRIQTSASFPRVQVANAGLPRLWAARKVGHLSRQLWTEGESPELVEEIRTTALRYGLPSPFTSILVQEPEAPIVATDLMLPGRPANSSPVASPARNSTSARIRQAAAAGTGAEAVQMAERSRQFRAAGRADEVDALAKGILRDADSETTVLAGRVLRLEADIWVEVGRDEALPVVTIERFSEAWFTILKALPELEPVLSAGRVEVSGQGLRLKIDTQGLSTLSVADRARLVRAFRPAA